MGQRRITGLLELAKALIGGSLIVFLVYVADWHVVLLSLSQVSLPDLLILLALAALLILVSVIKWRAFLAKLGISASLPHLYRLYLVGYFVNLVMPSYIGGDVVRSLYVGKEVDKARAVSATVLERYTGLLAMIGMACVALLFAHGLPGQVRLLVSLVALVAVFGSAALFSRRASWLLEILAFPHAWRALCRRVEDGLVMGAKDPRLLLSAMALSALFHVLTVVNTMAVAHAVGWTGAGWGDLFVVVPLVLIVGAVPISPQGLGIQEGAFVFFLKGCGASEAEALAVGLVLRAKSYLLACLGGALSLGLRKGQPGEARP